MMFPIRIKISDYYSRAASLKIWETIPATVELLSTYLRDPGVLKWLEDIP